MERCPNCGAPARPGAKFCTTCGFRLPESQPTPEETGGRSAPAGETAADAVAVSEPSAAAAPSVADRPGAPEASGGWGVPGEAARETGDVPAPEGEPPAGNGAAVEAASGPAEPASSWPSASPPWVGTWTADAAESAESADGGERSADAIVIDGAPSGEAGAGVEDREAEWPGAGELPEHLAAVDRALALLDELRLLVPEIASGATVEGGTDPSEVAARLEAAISLGAGTADLDDLRAAMDRARERPKDIDTVLDVAGRIDAVIALLDAYDRLRAAAEAAVADLRGDRAG